MQVHLVLPADEYLFLCSTFVVAASVTAALETAGSNSNTVPTVLLVQARLSFCSITYAIKKFQIICNLGLGVILIIFFQVIGQLSPNNSGFVTALMAMQLCFGKSLWYVIIDLCFNFIFIVIN